MTEDKVLIENEDFEIVKITNTSLFSLTHKTKELPESCQGMFTKPSLAMKAVDRYLELEKQMEAIKVAEDKGVTVSKKQKEKVEADGKS